MTVEKFYDTFPFIWYCFSYRDVQTCHNRNFQYSIRVYCLYVLLLPVLIVPDLLGTTETAMPSYLTQKRAFLGQNFLSSPRSTKKALQHQDSVFFCEMPSDSPQDSNAQLVRAQCQPCFSTSFSPISFSSRLFMRRILRLTWCQRALNSASLAARSFGKSPASPASYEYSKTSAGDALG